jgi:uncharacterized protein YciI
MTAVPPVRRQLVVNATPGAAFAIFTGDIGRWWPLAELSVFGAEATVSFRGAGDGAEIVEVSSSGEQATWGTVTQWRPGEVVAFTWHPSRPPGKASQVEVRFEDAGGGRALVTLEHRGWDVFADPGSARAEYDRGWPHVLELFANRVNAGQPVEDAGHPKRTPGGGETWVALLHTPGPAAPPGDGVFADARFGEHLAFLRRMQGAGYLVAAGPLSDSPGDGMTVLRLPGDGRLEDAVHLATVEDTSVASGFFNVHVRPWQVMLEAEAPAARVQ